MIVTVYSHDNTINWGVTGEYRIAQNVHNILRTKSFEVPFLRDMGINPDYIDSTTKTIKAELLSHVTEVINAYESRATVLDVRIEACGEDGEYVIAVDVEV